MERFDIAVAGNGLAGRIAAIALARLGYSVAIIGPAGESQDGRTTALMDQSIAFLEGLGVWGALSGHAAGLKTMQIIDGTGRLFRAPTVPFRASEIGLEAFGYNFPNSAALNVLGKIIADNDRIEPSRAVSPVQTSGMIASSSVWRMDEPSWRVSLPQPMGANPFSARPLASLSVAGPIRRRPWC